jgi:capsule biosynthesis phosphatase
MNSIIIDLDNTITIDSVGDDYPNKLSNPNIIRAIDNAHHLGFQCKIFSSRNMRTFKGDLEKIEAHTRPIAEDWLQSNEVNYHELILGKPWCGVEGWYIDDKNLSLEEFVFKFSGPYWNKSVSVVIPFYDEQENIINCHKEQKKIDSTFMTFLKKIKKLRF